MDKRQDAHDRSPVERPTPRAGEVHVWRAQVGEDGSRDAARRALAAILAGYLGGAEEAELRLSESGKPQLARDPERLSFNLSHSGRLALIGVAPGGTEVGVDIERLRPRRDLSRLAERWLPAADAEAIAATEDEREALFYAAWTRHEARVKCTGAGLAGPAPGPEVVAHQLRIDEGYAAAVAVVGAPTILLRDACGRR
jgi:4'-phosphopantetheinyl transferase